MKQFFLLIVIALIYFFYKDLFSIFGFLDITIAAVALAISSIILIYKIIKKVNCSFEILIILLSIFLIINLKIMETEPVIRFFSFFIFAIIAEFVAAILPKN